VTKRRPWEGLGRLAYLLWLTADGARGEPWLPTPDQVREREAEEGVKAKAGKPAGVLLSA
jgi:hypothetical protein